MGAAVIAAVMLGLPAILAPASPLKDMDEMAATFGVEIVWTSVSPCQGIRTDAIGCHIELTPSRIYVSPDLTASDTRYIVLHEIGHVVQSRLGIPLDECEADNFARSLGAVVGECPAASP